MSISGENHLWKISQQHDSQNRVVRRTIEKKGGVTPWKFDSETIFIYDGWSILEERTTNAAGDKIIRRYVHGPVMDEILRQDFFSSDGSIKSVYHHHDILGSNLCLSDTTGNAVEYDCYTAFGFPTILDTNLNAIPATKLGNRHLYTGREWLRELSLADHRNRYYSPHLARWTSTDPIKFSAGDVNLYRYVGNRPLQSNDLYGLCEPGSLQIDSSDVDLVTMSSASSGSKEQTGLKWFLKRMIGVSPRDGSPTTSLTGMHTWRYTIRYSCCKCISSPEADPVVFAWVSQPAQVVVGASPGNGSYEMDGGTRAMEEAIANLGCP